MPGIERIRIVSNWNDWRTDMAEALSPTADRILIDTFAGLGMELAPGVEITECTKEDASAHFQESNLL